MENMNLDLDEGTDWLLEQDQIDRVKLQIVRFLSSEALCPINHFLN
jgi:hypothetical protein